MTFPSSKKVEIFDVSSFRPLFGRLLRKNVFSSLPDCWRNKNIKHIISGLTQAYTITHLHQQRVSILHTFVVVQSKHKPASLKKRKEKENHAHEVSSVLFPLLVIVLVWSKGCSNSVKHMIPFIVLVPILGRSLLSSTEVAY